MKTPIFPRTQRQWDRWRARLRAAGWRAVQLESLSGFVWMKDGWVACLDFAIEVERGHYSDADRQVQHRSLIERYGEVRGAEAMLTDREERRQRDKERWDTLDGDRCQLCHAAGPDMRSMFFGCLSAVDEVVPEVIDLWNVREDELRRLYYLRLCKTCRGDLLGRMAEWRREAIARREIPKDADGCPDAEPEQNIPVRINGAVKMLTLAEYETYRAEREEQG